jgi:DNA-binding transcriptional LysR family regulator
VGFDAVQTSEVEVVELQPVEFMLVSAEPDQLLSSAVREGYVYVDWGTFFAMRHAQRFPDIPPPRLRVQTGRLARDHILHCGGSAYLARSMVQEELAQQRLFTVPDAPVFRRMTYAGYLPTSDKRGIVQQAISTLMD